LDYQSVLDFLGDKPGAPIVPQKHSSFIAAVQKRIRFLFVDMHTLEVQMCRRGRMSVNDLEHFLAEQAVVPV
jgi:hypothetical protein